MTEPTGEPLLDRQRVSDDDIAMLLWVDPNHRMALDLRDARDALRQAREAIGLEEMGPDDCMTLNDAFNILQSVDRILRAADHPRT